MRKNFRILMVILLQLQNVQPEEWFSFMNKKYYLSHTTLANHFPNISEEVEEIGFNFVTIPESSLEFFAQLLRTVKSFNFCNSAAHRIHLPNGLTHMIINKPMLPMELVIDQNVSYCLESLSISYLDKLPPQIAHLHSLQLFWCNSIPILELNLELFSSMENLTTIQVSKSSTTDIIVSESLQLKSLRELSITSGHLSDLNATSWNFPSLEKLDLSYNNFTSVPKQIATFRSLISLSMRKNQIEFIEMQTFAGMRDLSNLLLPYNYISRIVGQLQLPSLAQLLLDNNHLTELDVSGWHLPSLAQISLSHNRLKFVTGFVSCFGRTECIDMKGGFWDCGWLVEMGHLINGMVIERYQNKSCDAYKSIRLDRIRSRNRS